MSSRFQVQIINSGSSVHAVVLERIYGTAAGGTPAAEHLLQWLTVLDGDSPVGFMAIYENPGIRHKGEVTAQFGNFECIDDAEAANALLRAGFGIVRQRGASYVLGPMNGSTWGAYRFQTAGSGLPPFITEQQHPAYYPGLWVAAGFEEIESYISNLAPIVPAEGTATFFSGHGLRVLPLNTESMAAELRRVYPLCITAFAQNPYYAPVTEDAFIAKLLPLRPLLAGSFTRVVVDSGDNALAFILCLPEVLHPMARRIVVKTAAKAPACTISGLITMLNRSISNEAHAAGFREAIHAFMHAGNRSVERSADAHGQTIRRYALYVKTL